MKISRDLLVKLKLSSPYHAQPAGHRNLGHQMKLCLEGKGLMMGSWPPWWPSRYSTFASSHGETANGAAASAKSELVTYAYYVKTFKYYAPAIYHGQGLAGYGRMGSD